LSEKYKGPKTFEDEERVGRFVGHYNNDSPWYGDTRVVMRKGQLFLDGVQPLVPRGDGKFGLGDPEGRIGSSFESIVDGRAMRLNFSGSSSARVSRHKSSQNSSGLRRSRYRVHL
jgi:hypothetical protein